MTGCSRPSRTICPTSSGRPCAAPSWATAPCPRRASGHGARFRFSHCAAQTPYADWKASLFANLGASRHVRSDGVVTYDFSPLPELADAPPGRLRRREEDLRRRLPEAPHAAVAGPLVHGRRQLHHPVQGSPEAGPAGLTGRAEICVEAMEPATRERLVAYLADTWGIRAKLVASGAARRPSSSSARPRRRSSTP